MPRRTGGDFFIYSFFERENQEELPFPGSEEKKAVFDWLMDLSVKAH